MIPDMLELHGCTTEPLINYLKALGVLRLVSAGPEGDRNIRGFWRDGTFVVQTQLSKEGLEAFFLERYVPTPIVVPWSGSDFFDVKLDATLAQSKETPTGGKIIARFAASTHNRLAPYRAAITASLESLKVAGIEKKEQMKGEAKSRFLAVLRGSADPKVADWIDAAAVIEAAKPVFTAMLGSGGGSDGNTHFSDNFMQNVWDVFPEFDAQRITRKGQTSALTTKAISTSLLRHALFGIPTTHLVLKRTSSLFDAGAVGGPNAGQGFERDSLGNPWNFILAVEGTICFAGALCRRTGVRSSAQPAFPFQVQASPNTSASVVEKEQSGRELWLPIWERPAVAGEVLQIIAEGRMQTGNRPAASGVDAARAVAALGIDRGLSGFQRYAVVRGRVGGENYHTAARLGLHTIKSRRSVDLLRELDRWLSVFRSRCIDIESDEDRNKGNARFTFALRRIERSIFDYCRYGGVCAFQNILISLGAAERSIAGAPGFREKAKGLQPLANLSPEWVPAVDDGSREFEVALALAGIRDGVGKTAPLRANLEPVTVQRDHVAWAEKDRTVVWNAADLSTNLAALLSRRVLDGLRAGSESRPLASTRHISLGTVADFLAGELDEERVSDLMWGLVLCGLIGAERHNPRTVASVKFLPLPRAFALLKLIFLDLPENQPPRNALPTELFEKLRLARPSPEILAQLRIGGVPEACRIAARRLRASGFKPFPHACSGGPPRDEEWIDTNCDPAASRRIAASLLFPVRAHEISSLCEIVLHPFKPDNP
jgi:CRISPR-associated protein Csx17